MYKKSVVTYMSCLYSCERNLPVTSLIYAVPPLGCCIYMFLEASEGERALLHTLRISPSNWKYGSSVDRDVSIKMLMHNCRVTSVCRRTRTI